jgi:nucleoid-associated protein YgaU
MVSVALAVVTLGALVGVAETLAERRGATDVITLAAVEAPTDTARVVPDNSVPDAAIPDISSVPSDDTQDDIAAELPEPVQVAPTQDVHAAVESEPTIAITPDATEYAALDPSDDVEPATDMPMDITTSEPTVAPEADYGTPSREEGIRESMQPPSEAPAALTGPDAISPLEPEVATSEPDQPPALDPAEPDDANRQRGDAFEPEGSDFEQEVATLDLVTGDKPEADFEQSQMPSDPVVADSNTEEPASPNETAEETAAPEAAAPAEPATEDPQTAFIEEGANLWRLAREIYGSGVRYTLIYEANRDVIDDPDEVWPGQTLVIPPLPDDVDVDFEQAHRDLRRAH